MRARISVRDVIAFRTLLSPRVHSFGDGRDRVHADADPAPAAATDAYVVRGGVDASRVTTVAMSARSTSAHAACLRRNATNAAATSARVAPMPLWLWKDVVSAVVGLPHVNAVRSEHQYGVWNLVAHTGSG